MDNKAIADKLGSLIQLDFDAARGYEEAIEKIDPQDREVRRNLELFLGDHKLHVRDLSAAIKELGLEPPHVSRDIKGAAIEGMTSLMSSFGTSAALKAMQQNEKLTNKSYADAVSGPLYSACPPVIQDLLKKNYQDEQRHLSYINSALETFAVASK